jgi:hypothetical protein
VAHWRVADIHPRVHVSSLLTLDPSVRESESSSGAARARRMTASSAARPMQPNNPYTAPLSTVAAPAPEDVEHAVGRRCEAHAVARGGSRAGGGQRRPGVGRCAEAVQVVKVVCGGRRGTRARAPSRTGGSRRLVAADEAGSGGR